MEKLKFGIKVKDRITGFEGILTAHTSCITGCGQYYIQPSVKDNEFKQGEWFDETRIDLVDGEKEIKLKKGKNGCDINPPSKNKF